MKRARAGLSRIVAVSLMLTACVVSDEDEAALDVSERDEDEVADGTLLAGDMVVDRGINVVVPEEGETVTAHMDLLDGSFRTLTVENRAIGDVLVRRDLAVSGDADVAYACAAPPACSDSAYSLMGARWTRSYSWAFQASTTPTANDVGNVEARIREAGGNIIYSRNDCGMVDSVDALMGYRGRTSLSTQVNSSGGCNARDGNNVVGFGQLPDGAAGVTCSWASGGAMLEADVRVDRDGSWYASASVPSGCSNKVGVEAVMTHEFGHVFGVGHVAECGHPNLTMSTAISACNNSAVTLGQGDVYALRRLY